MNRLVLWTGSLAITVAGCGPTLAEQFDKAQKEGTVQAWDQFLEENGQSGSDAPEIEKAKTARDDAAWNTAKKKNSVEGYDGYLEGFPEGAHTKDAVEAMDDLAFANAKADGNLTAYLEEYPEGKHAKEAIGSDAKGKFEAARKEGPEALLAALKEHADSEHAQEAWETLEALLKNSEGGAVIWAEEKDGKKTDLAWVTGWSGGKAFKLEQIKLGKGTLAVKKGKAKWKGQAAVELVGDYPADPLSAVVLVRAGGGEVLISAPAKLKKKSVMKKGKAKLKISLKGAAKGISGAGDAAVFLVSGAVGSDPKALKPVSNIVRVSVVVKGN